MTRALTVLALLLAVASPAVAQSCRGLRAVGNRIDVSAVNSDGRSQPAVAYSATSDRYAIVWRENLAATGNDVYHRFVGSDGQPIGNPTAVVTKPQSQSTPGIAWNSTDDQFLVIWASQESGQDCFGRTLTAAGVLGAADFEILAGANEVRVAFSPSVNRYLVTIRGGGCDGQRVNPNSTLEGAKIDISTAGAIAPNGDVTYDTINNRFFAVFRDQGAMAQNIQGRIVNPDGTFFTAQFLVADVYPNAMNVAFNPLAAEYLVVCDRLSADGLRAQRVSAAGAPIGGIINITEEAADDPDVAYVPSQDAYVVVARRGSDAVAYVVLADGTVAADRVVFAANASEARVVYNPDTMECLAVWTQASGSDGVISARRLDFGGGPNACNPLCGGGLCGGGLCGLGVFPFVPLTVLGMGWMKRRHARH